ncbi:hypothetical protein QQF64_029141 [Cirrhinus molitorella]|uniref:Uncharacterized protein n=1 Tax=Cirrhinus molitorella TaxID=172907 RepID=A0ABR3N8V0_9TELE
MSGQQKSVTLPPGGSPNVQLRPRPHAQRSHAYYAAASRVSSYTMAPKPTEAFGCFPKKGIGANLDCFRTSTDSTENSLLSDGVL